MKLVNLDNIKYIFQIPLEWFQRVHNACFNSYGEDFIVVTNEDNGKNKIGINEQDFAAKVEQYASGKVKTVDGHGPDDDGEVSFELASSKPVITDANGHLTTANDEYATVDYVDGQIDNLSETIGNVEAKADAAQTTATAAQTAANAAQTTANNAYNGAVQAIADASRAYQLANEVDLKLTGVEAKADAAQTTATAAQTAASAAQTAAEDATELASEAYQKALDAEELADAADTKADEAKQIAQSAYSPTNKPSHNDISDWETATEDFVTTSSEPSEARFTVLTGTELTPFQPSLSGNSLIGYNNGTPSQLVLGTQKGIITNNSQSLACSETSPNSFIATNSDNQVGSLTSTAGGYPMFNANGVPQVQTFTPNKLVAVGSNGLLGTMDALGTGFMYSTSGSISTKAFGTTAGTVAEGNHTHTGYVDKPSGQTLQNKDVTVVTGVSWDGARINISASKLTFKNGLLVAVASATIPSIGTVTYNP